MANLVRWEPIGELDAMRRVVDRVFNQMFTSPLLGPSRAAEGAGRLPTVEVYTTDTHVMVKAELPGIDPSQVHVDVMEDAVFLSGELNREDEIQEDNYYRSERQYGHFERQIPLPNRVKEGEAKATFKHGLLTIALPLAEAIKKPAARRLDIQEE